MEQMKINAAESVSYNRNTSGGFGNLMNILSNPLRNEEEKQDQIDLEA